MIKEKIALIIDSMADLPQELVNRLGMKVIPARVIYPEGEYRDRVDIMPEEVYQRMPGEIPKTSVPSLQDIRQTIDHVREEGFTHAIALHISGALSGTAQAVQLISRDVQDLKIKVIDSKTLSMGTGWVALDAARQIANGVRFDAIVDRIHTLQSRVHVYYISWRPWNTCAGAAASVKWRACWENFCILSRSFLLTRRANTSPIVKYAGG